MRKIPNSEEKTTHTQSHNAADGVLGERRGRCLQPESQRMGEWRELMTTSGASSLRPPPCATIDRQSLVRFGKKERRRKERRRTVEYSTHTHKKMKWVFYGELG